MTSSTTLTVLLFFALVGLQVFSAALNWRTAGPDWKSARICTPRPHGDTLGERSTCPFTVTEDNDFKRIPPDIIPLQLQLPHQSVQ
ncbi:hypothetical protein MTO96_012240 [Rhipicephalus appendiculatus]